MAHALPPRGSHLVEEIVLSFYMFPLRLYCLRISDSLVILFNGAEKTSKVAQQGKTSMAFFEANLFAKRIIEAIQQNEIYISPNKRELRNFNGSEEIYLWKGRFMRSKIFQEVLDETPKEVEIFVRLYADLVLRINEILREKGYNQKSLAEKLEKRPSEIHKWLNGGHNFTLRSIAKLEAELGEKLLEVPTKKNISSRFYSL